MKLGLFGSKRANSKEAKKGRMLTVAAVIVVVFFLVLSAIPGWAESQVKVTINFKDQNGDISTSEERVYISGIGWSSNGDSIQVDSGKNYYYRAYNKQGSGLKGSQQSFSFTDDSTLDVYFRTITLDFEDQWGNIGAGDERVYIDYVGYKEDGNTLIVPQDSKLGYRAYYKQGSGLKGEKLYEDMDDDVTLVVDFITFQVRFPEGLSYTGDERIYIDYVGYKANNDYVTVPKDSTIYYRMYYKQGSGLKSTKGEVFVDGENVEFDPTFKMLTINMVDQNGDDLIYPFVTGYERVYIDYIGYKAQGETITVPHPSTVYYRAYYKQGSGLKGTKENQATSAGDVIDVPFHIVDIKFIDQYEDTLTMPPATGSEQVYIDYIGYKANFDRIVVPEDCTLYYRSYYKQGSGLKGNKEDTKIETGVDEIQVKFKIIEINLKDQNGEPEVHGLGAQTGDERAYIDYVGYVADGDELVLPLNTNLYSRAYYKQGSGLKGGKEGAQVVTCDWDVLNVEYKMITLKFVDQNGDDIGPGDERVYIDYVGYGANGDSIQVPAGSRVYYRAYYKQGSGLKGSKQYKDVDCNWEVLEIEFKRITLSFIAPTDLSGDEKVYIDFVGYKSNGDKIIAPMDSTIYYRAYYKQGSGLKGNKLSRVIDSNWDVLGVSFWSIKIKIVDSGIIPDLLTTGAQVYIDYVGYIGNDGILVTPMDSTARFKAKVGNIWSSKITKVIEHNWNLAIFEWDGNAYTGPSYFTEVTFEFYDQNGDWDDGPGYTGNEKVYVDTLGAYKDDGYIHRFATNTNVKYRAFFTQGGLDQEYQYSRGLIAPVMFQTLQFSFVDQDGDLSGTNDERVYVDSVGQYYMNDEYIMLPYGVNLKYRAFFSQGGLHQGYQYKVIDSEVETLNINFQSVTFSFMDQNGPLSGTTQERVYVDSVGQYYLDGGSISVPLGVQLQYRAFFSQGGLHQGNQYKVIDGDIETLNINFQTITFAFMDQNGPLSGTTQERVYVDSVGQYYLDGGSISVPLGVQLQYRAFFSQGGLHQGYQYKIIDGDLDMLDINFQTITFNFIDQDGDLVGSGLERVYVDSVGQYYSDGSSISVPLGVQLKYRAFFTESGLHQGYQYATIDQYTSGLDIEFWTVTYRVEDGVGGLVIGAQVFVDSVGQYVNNDNSISFPAYTTVKHRAKFGSQWSSQDTKVVDKTWTTCTFVHSSGVFSGPTYNTYSDPYIASAVTFKFVDQFGIVLPSSNCRIVIDGVSGYKADGYIMSGLTNGQLIKYTAYYSDSNPGYHIKGPKLQFYWSTGQQFQYVEFHRVQFSFRDQGNNMICGTNHRMEIKSTNGHSIGYRQDGDVEFFPLDSSIKYQAKYTSSNPGYHIYGTEVTFTSSSSATNIEIVEFHRVTFNFVDQDDNVISGTDHRIEITSTNGHSIGYRQHGDVEYFPLGSVVKYRAKYSSSSPGYHIYGTEVTYNADSNIPIENVKFNRVTFNFVDQDDNVISGTNHRIEIKSTNGHSIGYRLHGDVEYFPLGSVVKYRAKYTSTSPGYHIYGAEVTYNADSNIPIENVKFNRVTFRFTDQYGNVISGTGHRIEIKSTNGHSIGYRQHGDVEYFPLGSIVKYRAKYTDSHPGYHIYGTEIAYNADLNTPVEKVEFHKVTFLFRDQNGDVVTCTDHRIEIESSNGHSIGYRNHGDVEYLPKGSTIKYRSKYTGINPGYHIYGPEVTYVASSCMRIERVYFHKVQFLFENQDGGEISGTSHRIEIKSINGHSIGYRKHGDIEYFPLGSTIKYWAKYSSSNPGYHLYGPERTFTSDSTVPMEKVQFQEIICRVKDGSGSLISGAKVFIYSSNGHQVVGVPNGDTVSIPLDATFGHKGYVPTNIYSPQYSKTATEALLGITHIYDGSWSVPTYSVIWYVDASNTADLLEDGSKAHPFDTFGEALVAASDGDLVNVAPGLYGITSTLNLNKELTIVGPQAGVDPRPSSGTTRTAGDADTEAIVDGGGSIDRIFYITANNVVIDGLEIRSGTGDMIYSTSGSYQNDPIIRYNIIHDASGDEGIQLKKVNNGIIEYNHIYDTTGDGANIADSTDGIIRFNEIHDVDSPDGGIYCYGSTNMLIEGNLVYDVHNNDGIKLGNKDGADASDSGGVIKSNVVHDTAQDGISVYMSDVIIQANEVYNSGSENGAIYLSCGIENINIKWNTIHDNTLDTGKWTTPGGITVGSAVDADSVYINYNNIYNNDPSGLSNFASSGTVDAKNNWWGHSSGPSGVSSGSGDAVSIGVDYDPWLGKKHALVTVSLKNGEGSLMDTGTDVEYKVGSTWLKLGSGTTSGGTVMDFIPIGSYYFQLTHDESHTTNSKYQNIGSNPSVVFQTTMVTMELRGSMGCLMDSGGDLQYKVGSSYYTFGCGSTSGGKESMEMLPGSYYFYLTHSQSHTSNSIYQNIGSDSIVTFKTKKVTIELRDASDALMDTGTSLRYKVGSSYYTFGIGSTTGGKETFEMLPGSYYFYLTHTESYTSNSIYQNIGSDSIVTFKTTLVTMELRDASDALMDTGINLKYKVGSSYYTFGSGSTSGGDVGKDTYELLPGSYYFYLTHSESHTTNSIYQNIGSDTIVTFNTVLVTLELRDSSDTLMDTGTSLQYKVGSSYYQFGSGSTSGGDVGIETDELLPGSYYFYLTHAQSYTTNSVYQNIGSDSTVTFKTVLVTIELRDSGNSLQGHGIDLQYRVGSSYYQFGNGATSSGIDTMELLPGSFYFYLTHQESQTSGSKYQDIGSNPTVTFQTAQVISGSGSCTLYKVGSTWYGFTSGMEMMTGSYYFSYDDGTPNQYIAIATGVNNIH